MNTNIKLEDAMTDPKELKVEFAPGCFDGFDGTQEELDELIEEIRRMVSSGEILEQSRPVDFDDPTEDDLELIERLSSIDSSSTGRNLQ